MDIPAVLNTFAFNQSSKPFGPRFKQGNEGSRMEWAYSLRVLFAEAAATHSTLVKNSHLSRIGIICIFKIQFIGGTVSPAPGEEGWGVGLVSILNIQCPKICTTLLTFSAQPLPPFQRILVLKEYLPCLTPNFIPKNFP